MPDIERWPTGRLLSTAARLVEHAWNEKLSGLGLTHAGVIALEVLAVKGPITQVLLAQIVRVQAQTMGKTLARLEAHGYIERSRSSSDRRSQIVSLSDEGTRVLDSAERLEREVLRDSPVDANVLRGELQVLVRALSERHASPEVHEIVTTNGSAFQAAETAAGRAGADGGRRD
ncbi:MarR family winged helix-turn-helix transcriptional regulator [Arthrobacter cupressi]|uniref:DNA-binding transcriptional regulator, MarR family n=1 Tax=Arthrobacter cupressi TaxID=1045773 RepID=A0A1G8U9C2_9MICC|nr:MarR family transcriptional regulator [Arthrobacter cupressi]NYD76535.1 DNA-binding MarR family transcriptional regulator [Arthrobacter cupressi]SDJ50372.1 DNA-binding transcriptional regulator, MarR family [Arthrobacter cupressi]